MNEERLHKLAKFLREDLPEPLFDFRTVVTIPKGGVLPGEALRRRTRCGTTACAKGWMPAVFPETWRWEEFGCRYDIESNDGLLVRDFFDIAADEEDHLFYGEFNLEDRSGLSWGASKNEVADHIESFVAWKKQQR